MQTLGGRSEQAGLLVAAANAPLTFQRTLMPRSTVDQALVTGLSATANHALVTLLQEAIQSAALAIGGQARRRRLDEGRWGRTVLGADVASIGAGLALQRCFRQRHREPLARAGVRTGGFWLAASGTAAGLVGGLQELLEAKGTRRNQSAAVVVPTAAALAAANVWWVRRRSRLDADLPDEDTNASLAKSILYGVAIAGGLSVASAAEHRFADAVARALARVLPGNAEIWRPVGHALALSGVGYVTRYATEQMFHRIERSQESVEAAYDIMPPSPFVSGSYESLVPFDTLSRAGRRFVWSTCLDDVIEEIMGEPAVASPIRAYVGLESAPNEEDRVELTMRELERTGAFERSWLLVASPTGTGYVNYAAASIMEFLARGDCASVAMQYSARPSPLSLDRVKEGRHQARMLLAAIRDRLHEMPEAKRPKLVLFGESLGAWTSQDAYKGRGTQGLVDDGIDFAIWIGTPHFSEWKERVLYDDRPDIDRDLIGVFNDIGEWDALDPARRARIRYVMITHHDDGVALFGPELLIQAPEWLGPPASRPASVPKGMRWMPTTTFFQVLVDMKNAATVVPGVFAARGHDYRADLLPFFHEVLGFDATPDQLERIAKRLEARELFRSQWMKAHDASGKSLAASVIDRLIREQREQGAPTDERLMQLIRAVADDEFGAGGVAPATGDVAGSGSPRRDDERPGATARP
jgi:uncharacterized membrane protein